jgi:Tol biopolymer transport system component
MSSMNRRGLTIGCLCIALLSLAAPVARAATPGGPRLAVTTLSLGGLGWTLFTAAADGSRPATVLQASVRRHLSKPLPSGAATWSPDGQTLVFAGVVGVRRTPRSSRPRTMLFAVPPSGGPPRAIPGTADAEGPIFSPDGHTIAFARRRVDFQLDHPGGSSGSAFRGTSIWLGDIAGGRARRITPWQNGIDSTPSSFSPDGLTLGLTRAARKGRSEAVALRLDTGAETVLAKNAFEPVYSPDGTRIALLRHSPRRHVGGAGIEGNELVVIGVDGSGETRLTVASQGAAALPDWDPSGQRLAFLHFEKNLSVGDLLTEGDSVFEINADGTCPTEVFSARHVFYTGAVWQPGPGREAAPLSC